MAAWTGFAAQGRPSCTTSPAVIGTIVAGTLATAVAEHWATRSTAPWTVPDDTSGAGSAEPLNQSELRAVFVQLVTQVDASTPFRFRLFPFVSGTLAVLLVFSTVLPWRELLDPVALGPTASEAGLARSQLWEIPSARLWAAIVCGLAVATLLSSGLVRRAAAVATGSVVVAGLVSQLLWLPAGLPSGVGYRPAIGAWTALGLGLLLCVAGLARRLVIAGAAVVGVLVGVLVPSAVGTPYQRSVVAGVPHRLLDLQGGQLVDRLGMRVAIGTSDPLDSLAGTLDGSPGQWLLGRTAGLYNFYGPGDVVRRVQVKGELRPGGLVQLASGAVAMVLGEQLVLVDADGRTTVLLGGSTSGWPISATGVPASQWTADGSWFAGPDGKLWGYDGSHLVRVDAPGRVTVIAGPRKGVPQAADQVTVIGPALYFQLGNDLIRLEAAG